MCFCLDDSSYDCVSVASHERPLRPVRVVRYPHPAARVATRFPLSLLAAPAWQNFRVVSCCVSCRQIPFEAVDVWVPLCNQDQEGSEVVLFHAGYFTNVSLRHIYFFSS